MIRKGGREVASWIRRSNSLRYHSTFFSVPTPEAAIQTVADLEAGAGLVDQINHLLSQGSEREPGRSSQK
jgi:hypothetical protein